jgi:Tfp pilus assembly protein PilN
MPPEIAEAARFRRLQLAMGAAVAAAVVMVAGLYMHEHSAVSSARSSLNTAKAQQTSLQEKLNSLQSVAATFAAVQAKQQLLGTAMGQEIRWSFYLNDLSLKIPSNVWLSAVQASESTAPGFSGSPGSATSSSAATSLSAAANTIGTISFSGVGMRHDDVARWLDSLSRLKGFADPTFSSSTETAIGSRGVVDFGSQATVTTAALSNRYTVKAGS